MNGNAAPTDGLNSMFILVFADTAGTLKAISIRSLALIEFGLVAPFYLVVKNGSSSGCTLCEDYG